MSSWLFLDIFQARTWPCLDTYRRSTWQHTFISLNWLRFRLGQCRFTAAVVFLCLSWNPIILPDSWLGYNKIPCNCPSTPSIPSYTSFFDFRLSYLSLSQVVLKNICFLCWLYNSREPRSSDYLCFPPSNLLFLQSLERHHPTTLCQADGWLSNSIPVVYCRYELAAAPMMIICGIIWPRCGLGWSVLGRTCVISLLPHITKVWRY